MCYVWTRTSMSINKTRRNTYHSPTENKQGNSFWLWMLPVKVLGWAWQFWPKCLPVLKESKVSLMKFFKKHPSFLTLAQSNANKNTHQQWHTQEAACWTPLLQYTGKQNLLSVHTHCHRYNWFGPHRKMFHLVDPWPHVWWFLDQDTELSHLTKNMVWNLKWNVKVHDNYWGFATTWTKWQWNVKLHAIPSKELCRHVQSKVIFSTKELTRNDALRKLAELPCLSALCHRISSQFISHVTYVGNLVSTEKCSIWWIFNCMSDHSWIRTFNFHTWQNFI